MKNLTRTKLTKVQRTIFETFTTSNHTVIAGFSLPNDYRTQITLTDLIDRGYVASTGGWIREDLVLFWLTKKGRDLLCKGGQNPLLTPSMISREAVRL